MKVLAFNGSPREKGRSRIYRIHPAIGFAETGGFAVKAVGIVGFKKSGKTTLGLRLSEELLRRGQKVAVLKHVSGDMDFADTDTSKYKSLVPYVAAISSKETEIILKGQRTIEEILRYYFDYDIVLVEGFKREQTFPKIVCLRDISEREELFDGLQLFTAGFDHRIADFDILDDRQIEQMAAMVIEKSFKLPGLDCTYCGYESCYDFAKEIVRQKETIDKCTCLNPHISIRIDGTVIPLNQFASSILRNTLLAMLSSLKGFKSGPVEIEIP